MTFSWVDYLIVARHLTEHSTSCGYAEGCLRSVISRAYYQDFRLIVDLEHHEVTRTGDAGQADYLLKVRSRWWGRFKPWLRRNTL